MKEVVYVWLDYYIKWYDPLKKSKINKKVDRLEMRLSRKRAGFLFYLLPDGKENNKIFIKKQRNSTPNS